MRIAPPVNGWLWLKQGWGLFRRQPAEWMLLTMVFLLLSGVVNWIPLLGPYLATILIPALSVGLLQACAATEAGNKPAPGMLLLPFRSDGKPLLAMGMLYLLAMLAALGASSLLDGGTLLRQVLFGQAPDVATLSDGRYSQALLLAALLGAPMFMAFWFAPMLVSWGRLGVAQSLFYSFFASLRNWKAMSVYGMALFVALTAASLAIAMVGVAAGASIAAMRGVMVGLALVMMPAITCSFYLSYRDIFPHDASVIEPEQTS